MKTFTVKDFLTYNGPCFNCKSKVSIEICVIPDETKNVVQFIPNITNACLEVCLKYNYKNSLNLKIFHKTNKFVAFDKFPEYLLTHQIYLKSFCNKCRTSIQSKDLEFNFNNNYIKPVGIWSEILVVNNSNDPNNIYKIYSWSDNERSRLYVDNIYDDTTQLDLPICIHLYNFKNKEHFIQKMKTYLLFS